MGSAKLWFPSLKSVASHLGGLSFVLDGHCLFGRSNGLNCLYFLHGSRSLSIASQLWTGKLTVMGKTNMGISAKRAVRNVRLLTRTQNRLQGLKAMQSTLGWEVQCEILP